MFSPPTHMNGMRSSLGCPEGLRYAGVIQKLLLDKHLHFIGLWVVEDQRTNTKKTKCSEETKLRCQDLSTPPNPIHDIIEKTHTVS
jgi:hypothetical protein